MSKYDDHFFELYNVLASMSSEENKYRALKLFLEDGYEIKEDDIKDYFSFEGSDYVLRMMLQNFKGVLSKDTIMDFCIFGSNVPLPELIVHAGKDFRLNQDELMDILYSFHEENILSYKYLFDMFDIEYLSEDQFREVLDAIPEKAYKYTAKYLKKVHPDVGLAIWQDYFQNLDESKFYKDYYNRSNDDSYETAINYIKEGLSGDSQTDLNYLKIISERYKNHKYGKEIIREVERMIYNLLPAEKKEELDSNIEKGNQAFDTNLDKAQNSILKGDYEKAIEILEEMITEYETSQPYENDSAHDYYCFFTPMEQLVYRINYESRKKVMDCPLDLAAMYYYFGNALVELGRIKEAQDALYKARRWDPVGVDIAFEYAETFKILGDYEEFYEISKSIYPLIFTVKDLARYYRNLGYYYSEIKDYKTASSCYLYSYEFENSEKCLAELYYIVKKSGEIYDPPISETVENLKQHDIPLWVNEDILKAAYSIGKEAKEKGDWRIVEYFWGFLHSFVQDDAEIEETLKKIRTE